MKTRITLLSSFILIIAYVQLLAQPLRKYPVIGEVFPDHKFYDLDNFPSKEVSISDFKGKWLILDIWGYSCGGCLASFPKMNQLSKTFKEQIQIILVGATKGRLPRPVKGEEKITKDRFNYLKKIYNLTIPVAYDSVLYLKHDVDDLPTIFIINPEGKLVAKTGSVDSMSLTKLINGEDPKFGRRYSASEPNPNSMYSNDIPFLTRGKEANGGIDTAFQYRSLLAETSDFSPSGNIIDLNRPIGPANPGLLTGRIETFNNALNNLYQLAYTGVNRRTKEDVNYDKNYYGRIVIESKDSIRLRSVLNKKYTYSLIVPKSRATVQNIMRFIQSDLRNFFGYTAKIETRSVPVYFLEVNDLTKFKKFISAKVNGYGQYNSIKIVDSNFEQFTDLMELKAHLERPIINMTGVQNHVSLELEANYEDLKHVEKQLLMKGLILVEGTKEMKALVLKEDEE